MNTVKINVAAINDTNWLLEAAHDVSNATDKDFSELKEKKWYTRLWEVVTFSKDNQIRTANGVKNIAKLQEIVARTLVSVARIDVALLSKIQDNRNQIEKLVDFDALLLKEVQKIKYGGYDEIEFPDLSIEKQKLMANLLTMADTNTDRNDKSRRYIAAILTFAGVSVVDHSLNPSAIDLLDQKERELLYRLIATNRYLLGIGLDTESEVVDYITISAKRRNEIWYSIQNTAQYISPDFFASLYENTNYDHELLDDCDIDYEEFCTADDNEDVVTSIEDFEEITISNIVHIQSGESRVFRHKIIHMQAIIHCEGSLEFDTCVIHYGEQDTTDEIKLTNATSFVMQNCTIINHSYDKSFFIEATRTASTLVFEKCEFINCCALLHTNSAISMNSCNIVNPGGYFIHQDNEIATISNCKFRFEDYPSFMMDSWKRGNRIIYTYGEARISECTFIGDLRISSAGVDNLEEVENHYPYSYFISGKKLFIDNCSFFGLHDILSGEAHIANSSFAHCSHVTNAGLTEECRFDYCTEIGRKMSKKSKIRHCQFNSCFAELISTGFDGGIKIEFCEFNNWEAPFREPSKYSQFFPARSMLSFYRCKGKDSATSWVENCTFNGITAHQYFVIAGQLHEHIKDLIAVVENCNFINCNTGRESGKLIKEYAHYYNTFKARREIKAISIINNCRGLDRVNSTNGTNKDVVIKATSSTGRRIGIGAATIVAGVPGWITANIINDATTDDEVHIE